MTPGRAEPPALSIVAASRNDGHGGNILKRMRLFVQGLLDHSRRHGVGGELILVEWNPDADRPPLHEVLPKPSHGDRLTIRHITVPSSIHQRYRRAPELPLFQMIAKNVGIRRARGEFVLCTNVDLLFSDSLFRRLAGPLRSDTYYRANRCDVPDQVSPEWDLPTTLAWCERHVIRRLGRDPRYRNVNLELLGFQGKNDLEKWALDKAALALPLLWSREKRAFYQLDTYACGDFTLMSRSAWTAIQGYVELDLYSLHVDSLGLIAAAALGIRQEVFPREACTYHIDHPAGWEALAPLEKIRFLERRPALDYALVHEVGLQALRDKKPFGLNRDTWGYADVDLEEREFAPASGHAPAFAASAAHLYA